MVKRRYWQERIASAWETRRILWLSGVRRVGKTFLARSLTDVEFFDCEFPGSANASRIPRGFSTTCTDDASSSTRYTGWMIRPSSSRSPPTTIQTQSPRDWLITLGVSTEFRDTLAGRKTEAWLTPMTSDDLKDFSRPGLEHRLLHGGLPPFFLAETPPERDFQEWMDAYWAKDIQELFRLERRRSFQSSPRCSWCAAEASSRRLDSHGPARSVAPRS